MKKSLFLITLIISSASFSLIPAMEPVNAGSYGTKEGVLRVYNSKGLVEEHQISYPATNNEAKDFII